MTTTTTQPRRPATITRIFFHSELQLYGYSYALEGRPAHHILRGCKTLQDALDACDAWRELVWQEPSEADDSGAVLISRGFKPGSVMDRIAR